MQQAKLAGLTVVALTDHDTTAGWVESTAAAAEIGIELVHGLELSVEDGGQGHHLLAYESDPQDEALQAMSLTQHRRSRRADPGHGREHRN